MHTPSEDGDPAANTGSTAGTGPPRGPRGVPAFEGAACTRCGYPLTGLLDTGSCPECGMAVFDSLQGRQLRWSSPAYVRTLHRGTLCILVGSLLAVLLNLFGTLAGSSIGFMAAFAAGRAPAPAPVAPAPPGVVPGPLGDAPVSAPSAGAVQADAPGGSAGNADSPAPDRTGSAPPSSPPASSADGTSASASDPDSASGSGSGSGSGTTTAAAPAAAPTNPPTFQSMFAPGGNFSSTMAMIIAFATIGSAALELLVLFGWWAFSSPDPALPREKRGDTARRIIRTVVVIAAVSTIVNLPLTNSLNAPGGPWLGVFGVIGLSVLAGLAQIARFFAAMSYLRWLAPRLPDDFVDQRAKLYVWLLPVIYVVGTCVLIGPLVATVMQWLLLNRVRRDLRGVLDQISGEPEPPASLEPVT